MAAKKETSGMPCNPEEEGGRCNPQLQVGSCQPGRPRPRGSLVYWSSPVRRGDEEGRKRGIAKAVPRHFFFQCTVADTFFVDSKLPSPEPVLPFEDFIKLQS